MTRIAALSTLALVALALHSPAYAHPDHHLRGEAVLNPRTGHLEVALSVEARALRRALEANGDKVRWSDAAVDRRLATYVAERFEVKTGRARAKFRLAGWEPKGLRIWIYFELLDARPLVGSTMGCRLLTEVEPTHVSIVRVKAPGFRRSLTFDKKNTVRSIVATRGTAAARRRDSARRVSQ